MTATNIVRLTVAVIFAGVAVTAFAQAAVSASVPLFGVGLAFAGAAVMTA